MEKAIGRRIERLRKVLAENKLDTLIVLSEENRRYLSGFTGEDGQFNESAGVLFITDDKLILATDSRYEIQAKTEAKLYDIHCYKEGLSKEFAAILSLLSTKKLGFDSDRISYDQYNKLVNALSLEKLTIELIPEKDSITQMRQIKDNDEIEAIRKSIEISESGFEKIISAVSEGLTEKEIAWMLEKTLREIGADSTSFPIIVASGQNSAMPHARSGRKNITPGEPIIFDWGVKYNGYCSDITRTMLVGSNDSIFREVYMTVFDAQRKAIEAIKPGVSSKFIDSVARNYISEKGFSGKFGHGLGHGVGLSIHEAPRISPFADIVLEKDMVFTVEPGIYLPEWGGIRLENMVLVKEDGVEVLNRPDFYTYFF